ncbi:MAG: SpoIVB peptidase [Bacillota bacterium]
MDRTNSRRAIIIACIFIALTVTAYAGATKLLSGAHNIIQYQYQRQKCFLGEKTGVQYSGLFGTDSMARNETTGIEVIPGGQSIGIVLHSRGVMVVGMSNIVDETGKNINPAEEAGIKVGDLIVKVNGKEIHSEYMLRNEIDLAGRQAGNIVLEVKRGNNISKVTVRVVKCRDTQRPRIGLFVRDSASGVGTLSFYHPGTGTYGALGHIITDIDTAQGIDISHGKIVESEIQAIHKGAKGKPGEKIGLFSEQGRFAGNITKNTRFGIYGSLNHFPGNPFFKNPVPVAAVSGIKKGNAEIYTVIDGTEVKKYDIEIEDVIYPWKNNGKGMVIKITDLDLIEKTGGIVQGMSGSPIMQNGMLVGVVTHVFINDPLRGYGVAAEWMVKEAGLLPEKNKKASKTEGTVNMIYPPVYTGGILLF